MTDRGSAHIYPNWLPLAQKVRDVLPTTKSAVPGQRVWITETGWHTAFNSGAQYVSHDTVVKYLGRALAEFAGNDEIER